MSNEWVTEKDAEIGGGNDRWVKAKEWPAHKGGGKSQVLRIMSSVFAFYEGWSGNKPIRASSLDGFTPGIVWDTDNKYGKSRVRTPEKQWGVWAYYVGDPQNIRFWQINQVSIQRPLIDLAQSAKGAPTGYDIQVVFREGAKPPYTVQAMDSSPANPVAVKALADLLASGGKLEGILTSEGPFPRSIVAATPAPAADASGRNEIPF